MTYEPGQSGNPAGRPKLDKAFVASLRIAIAQAHDEGGNRLRAVAEALVLKAISGDVAAIREIADRLDGKVPQAVEGTGEDGSLVIQILRMAAEAK